MNSVQPQEEADLTSPRGAAHEYGRLLTSWDIGRCQEWRWRIVDARGNECSWQVEKFGSRSPGNKSQTRVDKRMRKR